MKYSVDKQDRYTIFKLNEDKLTSVHAPVLKSDLVLLHNEGVKNLVFDLSAVEFVDSSGLSAILTGNRLYKSGGSFVVTGIEHPHVKNLISISKVDTVLDIIPTLEESVEFVYMEDLQRELMEGEEGVDEDDSESK